MSQCLVEQTPRDAAAAGGAAERAYLFQIPDDRKKKLRELQMELRADILREHCRKVQATRATATNITTAAAVGKNTVGEISFRDTAAATMETQTTTAENRQNQQQQQQRKILAPIARKPQPPPSSSSAFLPPFVETWKRSPSSLRVGAAAASVVKSAFGSEDMEEWEQNFGVRYANIFAKEPLPLQESPITTTTTTIPSIPLNSWPTQTQLDQFSEIESRILYRSLLSATTTAPSTPTATKITTTPALPIIKRPSPSSSKANIKKRGGKKIIGRTLSKIQEGDSESEEEYEPSTSESDDEDDYDDEDDDDDVRGRKKRGNVKNNNNNNNNGKNLNNNKKPEIAVKDTESFATDKDPPKQWDGGREIQERWNQRKEILRQICEDVRAMKTEKEKMQEKMREQRLRLLRSKRFEEYQAYMTTVADEKIKGLLEKTDAYLSSLGERVKIHQETLERMKIEERQKAEERRRAELEKDMLENKKEETSSADVKESEMRKEEEMVVAAEKTTTTTAASTVEVSVDAAAVETIETATAKEGDDSNTGDKIPEPVKANETPSSTSSSTEPPPPPPPLSTSPPTLFVQPSYIGGNENLQLAEYQKEGIVWMSSLVKNNLNGILADEMGLGKTVMIISLFAMLLREEKENERIDGPFLVVVPLSTMQNWVSEFERWCPDVKVLCYRGTKEEREEIFNKNMKKKPNKTKKRGRSKAGVNGSTQTYPFEVMIVQYEFLTRDESLSHFQRVPWNFLVVDEGHRLKNKGSKLFQNLTSLTCIKRKMLLTGTPMMNNLTELWTLLHFLMPDIFAPTDDFEMCVGSSFSLDTDVSEEFRLVTLSRLHQVLRPFMLRRLKSDVLSASLPPCEDIVIRCCLSPVQRYLYRRVVNRSLLVYDRHGLVIPAALSNPQMSLRMLCNHPYLLDSLYFPPPDDFRSCALPKSPPPPLISDTDASSSSSSSPSSSFPYAHLSLAEPPPTDHLLCSGKFYLLSNILTKLVKSGHRILIFSQFISMLDLLEYFCDEKGIETRRLDGRTNEKDRRESLVDFNKENSKIPVFLLSTRAGGVGINLQTADTVILFDSDPNPQLDEQAKARVYRVGQKRPVLRIRLVVSSYGADEDEDDDNSNNKENINNENAANTTGDSGQLQVVEEKMIKKCEERLKLDELAIETGLFNLNSKDGDNEQLLEEILAQGDGEQIKAGAPPHSLSQINKLISRSKDEEELFHEMDAATTPAPLLTSASLEEWMKSKFIAGGAVRKKGADEMDPSSVGRVSSMRGGGFSVSTCDGEKRRGEQWKEWESIPTIDPDLEFSGPKRRREAAVESHQKRLAVEQYLSSKIR